MAQSKEQKSKKKKEYYEKNKEKILEQQKKYSLNNKEKIKTRLKKYYATKHGKIMQCLQNIKKRCEDPKNKRYERYGGRGIKNLLSYEDLSYLWDRDEAENLKKASLDRIDVNGNYERDNCQFIEMAENSRKDFIKAIKQIDKDGNVVKVWDAIVDAEKGGFQRPNIIKCLKGQRKTHMGYRWEYKE